MEVWKIYGKYKVSNFGQVRGVKGNILKQRLNSVGYYRVKIENKNILVHRLVAFLFVPNYDPLIKFEVDHIDGCKTNNRADNLQWLTNSENQKKIKARKKKEKRQILIFKDGTLLAEVISAHSATTFLKNRGYSISESRFVLKTATGEFKKYKGFVFVFSKNLFDYE